MTKKSTWTRKWLRKSFIYRAVMVISQPCSEPRRVENLPFKDKWVEYLSRIRNMRKNSAIQREEKWLQQNLAQKARTHSLHQRLPWNQTFQIRQWILNYKPKQCRRRNTEDARRSSRQQQVRSRQSIPCCNLLRPTHLRCGNLLKTNLLRQHPPQAVERKGMPRPALPQLQQRQPRQAHRRSRNQLAKQEANISE